jgi:hypothetical protein
MHSTTACILKQLITPITTKDMMTYVDLGSLGLDNKLENGGELKKLGRGVFSNMDTKGKQ